MISIVIPVCNEQENVSQLAEELTAALVDFPAREIVFVDDGSTDATWTQIETLQQQDGRIKGIRLSKNFGHQNALLAGLGHARGEAVITMDGDLQHPSSLLPDMIAAWRQGYKIVHTKRRDSPAASWLKKSTSRLYYKVFSLLSGVSLTEGSSDFRLLDRQVVNSLLALPEVGLFFRGIVQWAGFNAITITYQAQDRTTGRSKYTWRRMLTFAWTGITSFSTIPLRIGVVIGILTSLIAFGEMSYAIIIRLCTDRAVPGWASAVAVVSFLFGILFILLGIIGEYIGRILQEVKRRPRYLVSESTGIETPSSDALRK